MEDIESRFAESCKLESLSRYFGSFLPRAERYVRVTDDRMDLLTAFIDTNRDNPCPKSGISTHGLRDVKRTGSVPALGSLTSEFRRWRQCAMQLCAAECAGPLLTQHCRYLVFSNVRGGRST